MPPEKDQQDKPTTDSTSTSEEATTEETTSPETEDDTGGDDDFFTKTGFSLNEDDDEESSETPSGDETSASGEAESETEETSGEETGKQETETETAADDKSKEAETAEDQSAKETPRDETSEGEQTEAERQSQQSQQAQEQLSQEQLQELRDRAHQRLQEEYAITEEDANAILTEPEKVLPRLMANMHLAVYRDVVGQTYSMLPKMLHSVQESQRTMKEAEEQFFDAWPQLKEHRDEVARLAKVYRANNPQATPEQAIQQIGAMVAVSLGLVPSDQERARGNGAEAETPPTTPHRPATPGGGQPAATQSQRTDDNPYSVLTEEFLEEDQ